MQRKMERPGCEQLQDKCRDVAPHVSLTMYGTIIPSMPLSQNPERSTVLGFAQRGGNVKLVL